MKSSESEKVEKLLVLADVWLDLSSLLHSVQASIYLMSLYKSVVSKENLWEIISFSVDNSLFMAILTQ